MENTAEPQEAEKPSVLAKLKAVSYTHLDVYKRQVLYSSAKEYGTKRGEVVT